MKKKISNDSIIAVVGIGLSLLSMVIIFSKDTFLSFLITAIVAPFGFIGFWILLPFIFILGLYMLLKQKLVRFKVGLSLWGLLIIIFSLLILTSSWAEQTLVPDGNLDFGNVSPTYIDALVDLNYDPYNTASGGGFIGIFLAACLYSSITKIGTQIVCWVLIFAGLCLVFNRQIKKIFVLIRKRRAENKIRKQNRKQEEALALNDNNKIEEIKEDIPNNEETNEESVISPSIISFSTPSNEKEYHEAPSENNLFSHDFGNSRGLKKADYFAKDEDDDPNYSMFGSPTFSAMNNALPRNEEVIIEAKQEPVVNEPIETKQFEFTSEDIIKPQSVEEEKPAYKPQPRANMVQNYIYPPLDLLDLHEDGSDSEKNKMSTQITTDKINMIFDQLHIGAKAIGATVGPSVTRYDIQTNSDVSVSVVARYVEDISVRLNGVPVRFEKIVFGKATSGLEIPNEVRTMVGLRESISALPTGPKALRYIPFGKNISGELLSANLSDFPHMLVSGTTGSGKTIFMHSVILSLIMRNKPDELKIILIDPKKVEMSFYERIPHLLCPNISNSSKAYVAMKKLVDEMERRYSLFADNRVRDIKGFNEYAKANNIQPLPYIVVFIDEYADLVEEIKDIKQPVVRIAQKARAAGIHLVIATQRPSVNVIDGVIKANVSVRVALMVASQVDSISILGQSGAETLLGNGDMIIDCALINRSVKPRVQGCFVDNQEIIRVCDFLRNHYPEQYDPEFMDLEEHNEEIANIDAGAEVDIGVTREMAEEQLYELIKEQIVEREYCSISYIQRTYQVGFPKAGRLFNKLIVDGYVARSGGDARGSKVLKRKMVDENPESTSVPEEIDNNINDENGYQC